MGTIRYRNRKKSRARREENAARILAQFCTDCVRDQGAAFGCCLWGDETTSNCLVAIWRIDQHGTKGVHLASCKEGFFVCDKATKKRDRRKIHIWICYRLYKLYHSRQGCTSKFKPSVNQKLRNPQRWACFPYSSMCTEVLQAQWQGANQEKERGLWYESCLPIPILYTVWTSFLRGQLQSTEEWCTLFHSILLK